MKKIHRSYGDNGELLGYKISKEMRARGIRYANKCKRRDTIDKIMPYAIIVLMTAVLVAYYLILN